LVPGEDFFLVDKDEDSVLQGCVLGDLNLDVGFFVVVQRSSFLKRACIPFLFAKDVHFESDYLISSLGKEEESE
jgi:hypothetical protein